MATFKKRFLFVYRIPFKKKEFKQYEIEQEKKFAFSFIMSICTH